MLSAIFFVSLLSPAVEKKLLEDIDWFCADTWCEGNTDFAFHSIDCPKTLQECSLSVTLYPWGIACGTRAVPHFNRSCWLKEVEGPKTKLYWETGDCLRAHEEELYAVVPKACPR
ncbi:MAG: hypothetical protein I8H72_00510 [Myxococcaceae bacterium]|nr:hypothetical protein [Myxococcaceae bacterium]